MENSLTVKLEEFRCYPSPCTTVTYVALDKVAHPTAFRFKKQVLQRSLKMDYSH